MLVFQHQCELYICGSLRQLFSRIGVQYVLFYCLNTNRYSYLGASSGQSSDLYLNVVSFSTPVSIRQLWQLKTVLCLHWCPICVFEYQHLLLETSSGQSLHLNAASFSTPGLIRHLWQLKTAVFQHWCLICGAPLDVRV